ncbi:MAG: hypothetical protein AB1736_10370 [Chloroflexota bacterium]
MKRIAASLLWFYAFWYLGSMIASLAGVPDLLGPVLGVAAGIIVGLDPRGLIWRGSVAAKATGSPSTAPNATAPNAA